MSLLHAVDLAARALAIGMLLPLVVALLRTQPTTWSGRLAALFGIGAMAYALCSQPDVESGPTWLRVVLIPVCAGNSAVLWALVVALSDDAFEPTAIHVGAWLLLVGAGIATVLDLHHQSFRSNFGLYFTWWDKLMGTEHPEYGKTF